MVDWSDHCNKYLFDMYKHTWQAFGAPFALSVWDDRPEEKLFLLLPEIEAITHNFAAQYSLEQPDSLVQQLSKQRGLVAVPAELVAMLELYVDLNQSTAGKINPTIGFIMAASNYEGNGGLNSQAVAAPAPALSDALSIIDATHIDFKEPVLLDLGAIGKGFLIDQLTQKLELAGLEQFLIEAAGDMRYVSRARAPLACGLEDPRGGAQIIGTYFMSGGALCSSTIDRRPRGEKRYYLDPYSRRVPRGVTATWVAAETTALADGLASALMFMTPEALYAYSFEYCLLDADYRVKKSAGFAADFFIV